MKNLNYKTPTVDLRWSAYRETHPAIAMAIHAIADERRSPEAIWESPTNQETDHVKMALAEYVQRGMFRYDPDGYSWGIAIIVLPEEAA